MHQVRVLFSQAQTVSVQMAWYLLGELTVKLVPSANIRYHQFYYLLWDSFVRFFSSSHTLYCHQWGICRMPVPNLFIVNYRHLKLFPFNT